MSDPPDVFMRAAKEYYERGTISKKDFDLLTSGSFSTTDSLFDLISSAEKRAALKAGIESGKNEEPVDLGSFAQHAGEPDE